MLLLLQNCSASAVRAEVAFADTAKAEAVDEGVNVAVKDGTNRVSAPAEIEGSLLGAFATSEVHLGAPQRPTESSAVRCRTSHSGWIGVAARERGRGQPQISARVIERLRRRDVSVHVVVAAERFRQWRRRLRESGRCADGKKRGYDGKE